MNMRRFVPHIAAIVVIAGCAWLAQWQVERAGEKREIIDRWNAGQPLALETLERPFELPQPVQGVGIWDDDRQLLIDNRIRDQRTGVHVLTPLKLPDGRVFLVNRGWASWPARTAELPNPQLARRETEFRGVLNTPPGTGVRLGEAAPESGSQWPHLVTYFDYERLSGRYGSALQPAVIQLDPAHPAHLTAEPWQVVTFGPDRHIGYALTWTTIAFVVAAIWLVLTFRQHRKRKQ